LRHALLAVFWGFTVLEKVFEERDGYVMWRKMPARHPRTIDKWLFDAEGGVAGIRQVGTDANGKEHEVDIPGDRLLRFVWDEYFDNPEGFALFRSAYKPWFMKDWVYKVVNIGIERFWLNIPMGIEPAGVTKKQRDDVKKLLKGIRANEYAAMVTPHGWKIEMLEAMQRGGGDISMKYLEHHDQKILLSGLAQFLALGTTETGSRAVSEDHSSLFMMSEDALGSWFCEVLNRYAIPRLCEYNWPGLEQFPRVSLPPIATIARTNDLVKGICEAVDSAVITPTSDVEDFVLRSLHLPELGLTAEDDDQDPSEKPEEEEASAADRDADPRTFGGPALADREERINVRRIHVAQERAEDALGGEMAELIDDQLARLATSLKRPVETAVSGGKRARTRLLKTLGALELPAQKRYQSMLRDHLGEIAKQGADAAAQITGESVADVTRRLRPDLDSIAAGLAAKHAVDILFAIQQQVPRDIDAGMNADTVLRNVRQAVRTAASRNLSASLHEAADRIALRLTGVGEK
ncbi:MAG TPA: hypothetical protein QGH10_19820, partial [Armatimonadota bacterium]|nr:hypothetical protein [Armatimonadota bacterium]